jgi:hypothetical protein
MVREEVKEVLREGDDQHLDEVQQKEKHFHQRQHLWRHRHGQ